MSFTERSGARMRRNMVLLMIAGAVLPPEAAAVLPQSQSGSSSASRSSERSAERARREKLLMRLDSLRWEFEHERLSNAERERLKREMSLAVLALQEPLGDVRVRGMYPEEAERAAVAARAWPAPSPSAVSVSVRTGPQLRGYLGVTFDGPNTRDNDNVIRFYKYPMIALVEPSSPAERAGIRQGDTLLALNGIDVVAREIPLNKMLVPREQLMVKVRREGNAKELKVTVGEAPEYVMRRMPMPSVAPMPPMGPMGETRVRTPAPPGQASSAVVATTPGMSAVWVYNDGIGGAKVETITEGLGKALGVSSGVLVVRAGTGTMAYESGLRDGDVILRAAGRHIVSVRDLRTVIADSEDHEGVKLVIVRERKQREVTLRW